ncbi:hypothetical protein ABTZ59_12505 [Streptomyces sp. NPDC094034]|uniref:hypothetical protein n=1 Tax=Streptomyces sp. NPDC094034 TaxID=3155309 RepID=UPI003320AE6B
MEPNPGSTNSAEARRRREEWQAGVSEDLRTNVYNGRTPTRYLTEAQQQWQAGVSPDLRANDIYPPQQPPQGYTQGGSARPSRGYPEQQQSGPTYQEPESAHSTAAWASVGQDVTSPFAMGFQQAAPSRGYPEQQQQSGPTYQEPESAHSTAAWASVGQDVTTPFAMGFQRAAPSRGYPQPAASDEQTPAEFLRTQQQLAPLRRPYTIPSSDREPRMRASAHNPRLRIDTTAPPQRKGKGKGR